jgi:hypothetical protein
MLRVPYTRPLQELGGLGAPTLGREQVNARRRNRGGNFDLERLDHREGKVLVVAFLARL